MVPMRRFRGPSPLYRWLPCVLALACLAPAVVQAQPCTQSLPTGDLTGILNTYYPGVGTATAGGTTITVDTSAIRGASTTANIVAGDMLLVIQMQDAQFNQVNDATYGDNAGPLTGAGSTALNNSGRYEYVVAQGAVTGGVITIRGANVQPGPVYGLLNTYTTAARDDEGGTRRGQRAFQVVRVARRASGTLTAGLTASTWNGRTGGILAVDVTGALALGSVTVSLDGLGFRGGIGESVSGDGTLDDIDYMTLDTPNAHARKGEGIACTPNVLGESPAATAPTAARGGTRRAAPPATAAAAARTATRPRTTRTRAVAAAATAEPAARAATPGTARRPSGAREAPRSPEVRGSWSWAAAAARARRTTWDPATAPPAAAWRSSARDPSPARERSAPTDPMWPAAGRTAPAAAARAAASCSSTSRAASPT